MTIRLSRRFVKQLARQSTKTQRAFYIRLELFEEDPDSPLLRQHALTGKLKGFYSINVTGDVRALYQVINDEVYLYEIIGSHSQLYD